MKRLPPVSVVIITTDQFSFAGECIRSVLLSNYENVKIYLIDNKSNKKKYDEFFKLHKKYSKIKFVRLKKRIGFGGCCNVAIKKIKRGYIVLLNDDTIVTKNWLKPMIFFMEENPNVGAVQPKIKDMRRKQYFEYAGAAGGYMDVYGYPFCRGRVFYTTEKDKGQYNNQVDVAWTSGNCLVTRVDVIKKVGLFDEIFYIYQDEADLCWRMHFHGYKMVYIPKSVVYHYGSGTFGRVTPWKIFLHHRNTIILLLKNYTRYELIRYLPFRMFLDFVAFWYYLLDNRLPLHSLAILKSYAHLLYLLPNIVERRKNAAFKMDNANKAPYLLYRKSVIVDYFIKKKTKYSQLKMKL